QLALNFELAIAPLENNEFNNAKSTLKFMEYSASGLFGIFSNITPYNTQIKHLETGYLVENSTDDWVNAFEWAYSNRVFLKNKKKELIEMASKSFNLRHEAERFEPLLDEIFI